MTWSGGGVACRPPVHSPGGEGGVATWPQGEGGVVQGEGGVVQGEGGVVTWSGGGRYCPGGKEVLSRGGGRCCDLVQGEVL